MYWSLCYTQPTANDYTLINDKNVSCAKNTLQNWLPVTYRPYTHWTLPTTGTPATDSGYCALDALFCVLIVSGVIHDTIASLATTAVSLHVRSWTAKPQGDPLLASRRLRETAKQTADLGAPNKKKKSKFSLRRPRLIHVVLLLLTLQLVGDNLPPP
jgi:hypothetical protein